MSFDEYGILNIFVTSAGAAIPIKDALVHIRGASEENADFNKTYFTDIDGLVKNVVLPTPDLFYSLTPSPAQTPFGLYDIDVMSSGYYKKEIYNAAVFSGIESTLPVNMIPMTVNDEKEGLPNDNLITYIEEKLYIPEVL